MITLESIARKHNLQRHEIAPLFYRQVFLEEDGPLTAEEIRYGLPCLSTTSLMNAALTHRITVSVPSAVACLYKACEMLACESANVDEANEQIRLAILLLSKQ